MTLRSRPSDRPETAAIFRTALNRIQLPVPVAPAAPPAPTDTSHHVPVDGTRAYPVDATPPFGTEAPAPEDRRVRPVVNEEPAPASTEVLRTNQRRASWTVGGLVAAALVTALVLVGLTQRDGRSSAADVAGPPATTVAEVATTVASPTVLQAPPVAAGTAIVSAAEFDPEPGDGREHPEQLGLLTDGRTDTTWSTSCYRQPTMAPKDGVGLVFWLSGPARGNDLVLTSPSEGWSASVFVASEVGGRLRDWGPPVDQGDDLGPGQVELHLGGTDGRFVLVWFTNLGEPGCDALPHQLRVGEVTVVQA
jgi:hypothetical protein